MRNTLSFKFRALANCSGFTLLEVMVALSVISIVLVSVLRMQGQTISMNEDFRFYTTAPQLAGLKMAGARLAPDGLPTADSGNFGDEFRGCSWDIRTEDLAIAADEETEMELIKVEVVISCMEGRHTYTISEYMPAQSFEE